MTISSLSVWLLAVGGLASSVAFLGQAPKPRPGLRFGGPLPSRDRLLWAFGAAGAIFVGIGGIVALLPNDLGPFDRVWVIVLSLALLLLLAYGFAVERLVLDRRTALERIGGEVHRPRLTAQQGIRWALLHPLYDEDRETEKRRLAVERREQEAERQRLGEQ